ncbi:MAG: hypothetical protein HZB17_15770 [Chloroflexi bacterium]|nr:hypothetical protein [Chloroflexota bacterium]
MSNLSSRPTQIIIGIMIIIALSACQPNAATIEPAVANTPTVQPSNTPVPTTTLAPTKISSLTSSATQRVEAVATSQPTPKELIYMNKVETKFIEPVLDGGKFEDLNGKLLGVLYEVAKPTNPGQLFYTKGVEVFKGSDGSIYST